MVGNGQQNTDHNRPHDQMRLTLTTLSYESDYHHPRLKEKEVEEEREGGGGGDGVPVWCRICAATTVPPLVDDLQLQSDRK